MTTKIIVADTPEEAEHIYDEFRRDHDPNLYTVWVSDHGKALSDGRYYMKVHAKATGD